MLTEGSEAKKIKKINKIVRRLLHIPLVGRIRYSGMNKRLKVEAGKTMFFTFQGKYTCNPKYISMEMLQRNLPWKQVWVIPDGETAGQETFPPNADVVAFGTRAYYEALSTSQFLIDNAFNFEKGCAFKKLGQYYLETMHGSLGIKKIGPDAVRNIRRNHRGQVCGKVTDYVFSNSTFENMVYETSFWRKESIALIGHARNDIFFLPDDEIEKIRRKVRLRLGLDDKVKLAMYAPTVSLNPNTEYEKLDFRRLKNSLLDRFGGEWVILNRSHHTDAVRGNKSIPLDTVDVTEYPDIQELMLAIDVGITDYSSWIFDYVLSKKIGFLYVPDLEDYDAGRGFYYPLTEVPFPIAKNNEELIQRILSFSEEDFQADVEKFLERRGCIDDGHASERIVDLMTEIAAKQ